MNVCVIMTTYGRRDTTLKCLHSLAAAAKGVDWNLQIVMVDASSPDGTADAVAAKFPRVQIFSAPASTYWAGGMRLAWLHAQGKAYDALLWLNDDVVLYPDALLSLNGLVATTGNRAVVVGAFEDAVTRAHTYGGAVRGSFFRRMSFQQVKPSGSLTPIDAANGNLVWVPSSVDASIGGFPSAYSHSMADNAFSLDARRLGVDVFLSPQPMGCCSRNVDDGTWKDTQLSAMKRLSLLRSPKGLPASEYWRFCIKYGGVTGILYAVKPYVRLYMLIGTEWLKKMSWRHSRSVR